MKKKILFFLLLPLLAETILSCCDCPETETLHYTNKTMLAQNPDNSGQAMAPSGTEESMIVVRKQHLHNSLL